MNARSASTAVAQVALAVAEVAAERDGDRRGQLDVP